MNGETRARTVSRVRRRAVLQTLGLGAGLALGDLARAATPGVDEPPPAGPPRPVAVPMLQEERLPNGLTLIVAQRSGLPLVTARVLLRGGSQADPAGQGGTAALVAQLLAAGALRQGRPVDATTLARQAESLGGTLDVGATAQAIAASMTVTTPRLDAALALLSDVVRHPLLSADELARSRDQMTDSLKVALADPAGLGAMVARRLQGGDTPAGAVTTPASLGRIRRADVQAFHARWARPDLAALVLAGDIDMARARDLAWRHVGRWVAPAADPPPLPEHAPEPLPWPAVLVDQPGAGQSCVIAVSGFSAQADADRRAGQVAVAVLGGGYSARLNQVVRIQRGLAYGASARGESSPRGGMLQAVTQTDHRNVAQVAQLLRDELARMGRDPPGAAELAARQASLVGDFARVMETTAGLAARAAELWTLRRPVATLARLPAELQAVTAAQVADYAQRRWPPEAVRLVVVGDLRAAALGDDAPWAGALRLSAAQLDFDRPRLGER